MDSAPETGYATRSTVLFLIFNRPYNARRSFEAIRNVRPNRLFVAADGPRPENASDKIRCAEARQIIERVDWPCDVTTLFRDENLGCADAVSRAISWFFEHVDEGIIIEDDCIPSIAFFRFIDEMLVRYRNDTSVSMITGDNFLGRSRRDDASYYFSRLVHVWGWATWRRAWRCYDHSMTEWPRMKRDKWLLDLFGDKLAAEAWTDWLDATARGQNSSWAWRWTASIWSDGGKSVVPRNNLVENIGFGRDSTHSSGRRSIAKTGHGESLGFPLIHNPIAIVDRVADRSTQRAIMGPKLRLIYFVKRLLGMSSMRRREL